NRQASRRVVRGGRGKEARSGEGGPERARDTDRPARGCRRRGRSRGPGALVLQGGRAVSRPGRQPQHLCRRVRLGRDPGVLPARHAEVVRHGELSRGRAPAHRAGDARRALPVLAAVASLRRNRAGCGMGRRADGRDRHSPWSAPRETRAQLGAHRPAIPGSHRGRKAGPGDLPDGRFGRGDREMTAVAQSLETLHAPPTRWAWLVREMAPSEERWNATIRLVVAVVTVVVVSMALQTPLTAYSAYMVFFITKENRVITTITGILGFIGATIAVGASLFIYHYTFDYPEYRLPAMAAAVFRGMWLSRVLTLGPLGFVIGFLVGLILSISDGIPTADHLVREVLWLWVVAVFPLAITVVVNIALLPADPLTALEKGLRQRLELTIAALRRMIGSNVVGGGAGGSLVGLASPRGAALQLDLQ